ncbi:hypothetical protein HS088_TW23G00078 [Tripterygium wilfordii]|uniref:25S rRNA (uridine-N(3))-methyltransferase BMT5-like domain-containing protein n=1 Tax=Tripterygium wilfordii TaxID=458696 RepID=A0A7J7BUP9_TRIWF|nr:hypothetical protein HS088_TW23G00078 [Tripterygium wilfordii]
MGKEEREEIESSSQEEEDSDEDDYERGLVEKWKTHYSSKHRILLVGEGDFSFSLCLAREFGSALNMVASSLDSQGEIHISHKEGDPYNKWDLVKKAEKIGLVLHEVVPFNKVDYPGYNNKRAQGSSSMIPFTLAIAVLTSSYANSPIFACNEITTVKLLTNDGMVNGERTLVKYVAFL